MALVEVEIRFLGRFQVRLATDPDPADHPRGQFGWTRAYTGESDLDRIIRFNDPVAPRPCGAEVKTEVTAVLRNSAAVADALVGAPVNLGPNCFFEGGPLAPPGLEPIKNFELHFLRTATATTPTGADFIEGKSTRPPVGQGVGQTTGKELESLRAESEAAWDGWINDRKTCIQNNTPASAARTERLDMFDTFGSFWRGVMSFRIQYQGLLDASVSLAPHGSTTVQELADAGVTEFGYAMVLWAFDADTLVGRVNGSLTAHFESPGN